MVKSKNILWHDESPDRVKVGEHIIHHHRERATLPAKLLCQG